MEYTRFNNELLIGKRALMEVNNNDVSVLIVELLPDGKQHYVGKLNIDKASYRRFNEGESKLKTMTVNQFRKSIK